MNFEKVQKCATNGKRLKNIALDGNYTLFNNNKKSWLYIIKDGKIILFAILRDNARIVFSYIFLNSKNDLNQ